MIGMFMGKHYRRYIVGYNEIIRPVTRVKNKRLVVVFECETGVRKLREFHIGCYYSTSPGRFLKYDGVAFIML